MTKVQPSEHKAIALAVRRGVTLAELASAYGCSKQRISEIARQYEALEAEPRGASSMAQLALRYTQARLAIAAGNEPSARYELQLLGREALLLAQAPLQGGLTSRQRVAVEHDPLVREQARQGRPTSTRRPF